jgi:hypothetical protein
MVLVFVMNLPLMPKATAMWLVENTSLTFEQIADFCGLHILEVTAIANGDMDAKMCGFDPVVSAQLTIEEIRRCEADKNSKLVLKQSLYSVDDNKPRRKYTPRSKRQDRPDAIAWLAKYYPEVSEVDICRLLGTTKATIRSIKSKTNTHSSSLTPRSPVVLGLCSEAELDFVIAKLNRE